MAVRMYLDSSGKTNDPRSRYITLTAITAAEEVWDEFVKAWYAVLTESKFELPKNSDGLPYIHTADLMRSRQTGDFSHLSAADREGLLRACVSCAARFKLSYQVSVVPLEPMFQDKKHQLYKFRSAEWLCLSRTMLYLGLGVPDKIDMYFDRNEDYMKLLVPAWEKTRHRDRYSWLSRVRTIAPVVMNERPEIQLADIVAWAATRGDRDVMGKWLHDTVQTLLKPNNIVFSVEAMRRAYRTDIVAVYGPPTLDKPSEM